MDFTYTTYAKETANNTSAAEGRAADLSQNAATGNVSRVSIKELVGQNTTVFANWISWHRWPPESSHSHSAIGYNSNDDIQVARQVKDAKERGIDGFIVSWEGPKPTDYREQATKKLLAACEAVGLKFIIMFDQTFIKYDPNPDKTAVALSALAYCNNNYFKSPSYYRDVNNRPVFMEFGFELVGVDFSKIPNSYAMICRNKNGYSRLGTDGVYSWIDSGISYLKDFWAFMSNMRLDRPVWGSAFHGFNDSTANWSPLYSGGVARTIPQNNGQTFLDTLDWFKSTGLTLLQLATWNDYEEGTALEPGIDAGTQVYVIPSAGKVTFNVTGNLRTVHHVELFVGQDDTYGQPIVFQTTTGVVDLATMDLPLGDYQVFVKVVGQPMFQNKFSTPIVVSRQIMWTP